MRLINALEAGTLNSAGLQALLTSDPTRLSELSVMYGMRGQARRIINSHSAFTTLLSSSASLNHLLVHPTLMAEIKANASAYNALLSSDTSRAKLYAAQAGLDPQAYSSVAGLLDWALSSPSQLSQALRSEGLFLDLLRMPARMSVIDASASLRATVYGGALGGGYLGCVVTAEDGRYAVIQAPKIGGENASVQWKLTNTTSLTSSNTYFGLPIAEALNDAQHPLFQWSRSLTIGGYIDWAPPTAPVLQLLLDRMRPSVAENALFKVGGAQAYEAGNYWAACPERDASDYVQGGAPFVNSLSGAWSYSSRDQLARARAVRMIKL